MHVSVMFHWLLHAHISMLADSVLLSTDILPNLLASCIAYLLMILAIVMCTGKVSTIYFLILVFVLHVNANWTCPTTWGREREIVSFIHILVSCVVCGLQFSCLCSILKVL